MRSAIIALALLVTTAAPAASQEAASKPDRVTSTVRPVELPRLFNVPTAEVLGSLDAFVTAGGSFGAEKEKSFLGRAGIGLGDVAEIELSTLSVINSLQANSVSIPTSAFKMRVFREKGTRPSAALALRGTTSWQHLTSEEGGYASFEMRLTKLYAVASKSIGTAVLHGGVGLTDVRVRRPFGWSVEDSSGREMQKNLVSPFAGVSVRANPRTLVMGEVEGVPQFDFETRGVHGPDAVKTVWAGVVGVRFYLATWLATDAGVRYRSDFDGIADANIHAALNVLLPLGGTGRHDPAAR